jgi:hypothetical protein
LKRKRPRCANHSNVPIPAQPRKPVPLHTAAALLRLRGGVSAAEMEHKYDTESDNDEDLAAVNAAHPDHRRAPAPAPAPAPDSDADDTDYAPSSGEESGDGDDEQAAHEAHSRWLTPAGSKHRSSHISVERRCAMFGMHAAGMTTAQIAATMEVVPKTVAKWTARADAAAAAGRAAAINEAPDAAQILLRMCGRC